MKSDADVRDVGAADPAPVHVAARHDPAHAPAVERALLRDGHDRRLRLQPMAPHGSDALA